MFFRYLSSTFCLSCFRIVFAPNRLHPRLAPPPEGSINIVLASARYFVFSLTSSKAIPPLSLKISLPCTEYPLPPSLIISHAISTPSAPPTSNRCSPSHPFSLWYCRRIHRYIGRPGQ